MDSFPSSLWSSVQESILYFQGGRDVGRDDEGSPSQLTGLHFDISNPLLIAFDHHPSFQSVHSQSWIRDIKVETLYFVRLSPGSSNLEILPCYPTHISTYMYKVRSDKI